MNDKFYDNFSCKVVEIAMHIEVEISVESDISVFHTSNNPLLQKCLSNHIVIDKYLYYDFFNY